MTRKLTLKRTEVEGNEFAEAVQGRLMNEGDSAHPLNPVSTKPHLRSSSLSIAGSTKL